MQAENYLRRQDDRLRSCKPEDHFSRLRLRTTRTTPLPRLSRTLGGSCLKDGPGPFSRSRLTKRRKRSWASGGSCLKAPRAGTSHVTVTTPESTLQASVFRRNRAASNARPITASVPPCFGIPNRTEADCVSQLISLTAYALLCCVHHVHHEGRADHHAHGHQHQGQGLGLNGQPGAHQGRETWPFCRLPWPITTGGPLYPTRGQGRSSKGSTVDAAPHAPGGNVGPITNGGARPLVERGIIQAAAVPNFRGPRPPPAGHTGRKM